MVISGFGFGFGLMHQYFVGVVVLVAADGIIVNFEFVRLGFVELEEDWEGREERQQLGHSPTDYYYCYYYLPMPMANSNSNSSPNFFRLGYWRCCRGRGGDGRFLCLNYYRHYFHFYSD